MQTGTLLYRGRRSAGRLNTVLLAMAIPVALRAGSFEFIDAWERGRAGSLFPSETADPFPSRSIPGNLSLRISCSRPHDIDDLFVHSLDGAISGGAWECRISWGSLRHRIYREDRAALSVAAAPPLLRLRVRLKPLLVRRTIPGYPSEGKRLLLVYFSTAPGSRSLFGPLSFEIESRMGKDAPRLGVRTVLRAACSIPGLSIIVNRIVLYGRGRETRLGIRMSPGDCFSIDAGYRTPTNETALGILFRNGRFSLCVSWSHHPVLGKTLSAGVGWGT